MKLSVLSSEIQGTIKEIGKPVDSRLKSHCKQTVPYSYHKCAGMTIENVMRNLMEFPSS